MKNLIAAILMTAFSVIALAEVSDPVRFFPDNKKTHIELKRSSDRVLELRQGYIHHYNNMFNTHTTNYVVLKLIIDTNQYNKKIWIKKGSAKG